MSAFKMGKCLNRVELIGRLGTDPEEGYPAPDLNVCTFWLVTTDFWKDDEGATHEGAEWHRIVAWGLLAEHCYQFLYRGALVYVQGHLTTRQWRASDEQRQFVTEIVLDDVIILPSEPPATNQIYLPDNTIRADEPYATPSTPDLITQRKLSTGI